jgi:hypothetical protein
LKKLTQLISKGFCNVIEKKRAAKNAKHLTSVYPLKKHKRNGAMGDTGGLTPGKSQSISSGFADEVNRLISRDKIKAALSRAKVHHKHLATVESKMVLVDA